MDLQLKHGRIWTRDCVVEKVIEFSGEQFDYFCGNLLKSHDFIKENNDLMRYDGTEAYRCLLVTGEGRENGILVNSDGYDRAQYTSVVPHVRAVIAASRYPALAQLNEKLIQMTDHIVAEGLKAGPGERASVSMDALEEMSGINVAYNSAVVSTLQQMINDRPEIADWEIDKDEFIITPTVPEMTGPEQAHEPTLGM